MPAFKRDVIVIGGGLSGLSAATLLDNQGVDVVVLEANSRLGGRVQTVYNESVGFIDLGGTFVGPTQDRILGLAKELGVRTQRVLNNGDMTCYRKGEIRRFQGVLPPMGGVTAALDANHVLREMHQLCEQISMDKPWKGRKAAELDSLSFQEFLDRTISSQKVKDNQTMLLRLNMTSEPYEVSLLWALWYIKGAGGIYRMNAFEGGAQESTFIGGAQQLADKMAEKLPGKVFVDKPVVKIHQESDRVTVFTTAGQIFQAKYVILATPPSSQQKILFEPSLPVARSQLIQRVPLGCVIKTFCYYSKPFWTLKGLSGTTFVEDDDLEFPVVATIDYSREDGSYPCILGFIAADKARILSSLTADERRDKIARQYAKLFECDSMLTPAVYEEKNWMEDPWAGGCYTGYMAPRVMTSFGRCLRKPIGRLHFAGTETATAWSGYMDGAIEAGERAAREVLYVTGRTEQFDSLPNAVHHQQVGTCPTSAHQNDVITSSSSRPSVDAYFRSKL